MALQPGALRSALVEAGASEEKASRAAGELASYKIRFAKLEAYMVVVKLMLGILLAGIASPMLSAFL